MEIPTLFVGKSFSSYTELTLFITEYEAYHRQKFWKRSSRKIASTANIKRHINPELIYYEISYSCVHGGEKFKSRSKGLRKSMFGSPCSAYIRLRASPDGQSLDVKAFSDQHNHISMQNRWTVSQIEILIEQYKKYPVLYDTKHEEYNNITLKNDCLATIVQALQPIRMGVTEVDVLSQWNNLMVKYLHAHQLHFQTQGLNDGPQLWYLQKLDFLKDFVSVYVGSDVKLEDSDYDPDFFEPEIGTEWDNGVMDPLSSSSSRIKEENEESGKKLMDEEDSSERDLKVTKDENDIFGEFVAAQLKKIVDEELKQDTVFEIHQVLHKALKKK